MLLLAALIFSVLAFVGFTFAKSPIHPSVVFCGCWAVSLALIAATGDLFYPISAETLLIIISGGCVFCLATWIASLFPSPPPKPFIAGATNRILNLLVWLVVLATPLYFRWLIAAVASRGSDSPFLMVARMVQMESLGSNEFRAAGGLVELAQIVAVLCFWHRKTYARRALVAILLAFLLSMSLGQKAAPFILAMELICVDWLQNRRLRRRVVISLVLAMVSVAVIFEFYVHLGGGTFQVSEVLRLIGLYVSGGIAGFDRVVRDPSAIAQINPIYVVWLRIAKRFGVHVTVPEVAEFLTVGPHGLNGNVYTIFWSYLNFGYVGDILAVGVLGFIAARVYRRALQGGQPWVVIYAKMFFGIAFSTFTEYFVGSIYIYGIIITVIWMVYFLPLRLKQFTDFNQSVLARELTVSRR